MNRKIGIVICNYNKKDFVLSCIESVLCSTDKDFDLYVVDNASSDGSAQAIQDTYGDRLTLIVNDDNLGGSGGFNTGLRVALAKRYDYYMCVDNDIVMEPDNIENLRGFLDHHADVGIVGSKICRMKYPDHLQELGAMLDFDICMNAPCYKDYLDNDVIPEVQYCDYVPACSLMIRHEVIEQIGLMPEDNFIYWDDMEWGWRTKLAGWKVAAYSKAKVYHDMGTNSGTTYFSTYYFWRNRIRFFRKFTPEDKREHMKEILLENLFQTMYGCYYKGKKNQIHIMMHAFDDALHDCAGKAAEGKILPKDEVENRLAGLMKAHERIAVEFDGNYKLLQDIIKTAHAAGQDQNLMIVCADIDKIDEVQKQNPQFAVVTKEQAQRECEKTCKSTAHQDGEEFCEKAAGQDRGREKSSGALWLTMCAHVSKVADKSLQTIYIDPYSNLLADERDLQHFASYEYNKNLFVSMWKVLI